MGNFLAAGLSIFVPLFNHLITIPFIFHPYRWGGTPWSPPHWMIIGAMKVLLNISTLMLLGTLSGMMNTQRQCRKIDLLRSIKRSLWLVAGYFFGNAMLFAMPFIKVPLLAFTIWIPYSGWIVHGVLLAAILLFFGAMGNSFLRAEVCQNIY
jgi:hypothetical protein